MTTHSELKKLAEAATPIVGNKDNQFFRLLVDIEPKLVDVPMSKSDLRFYSAANPLTIIALLEENAAMREALKKECYCCDDQWTGNKITCDPCNILSINFAAKGERG